MKRHFGPSRTELKRRVAISSFGMLALVGAVGYRGWPPGFAMLEVLVIGGLFFGGTLLFSLRKLQRRDHPPED
ncbi:MAG: hypothetical protein AB8B58_07860 [Roseobacter sp.]